MPAPIAKTGFYTNTLSAWVIAAADKVNNSCDGERLNRVRLRVSENWNLAFPVP